MIKLILIFHTVQIEDVATSILFQDVTLKHRQMILNDICMLFKVYFLKSYSKTDTHTPNYLRLN